MINFHDLVKWISLLIKCSYLYKNSSIWKHVVYFRNPNKIKPYFMIHAVIWHPFPIELKVSMKILIIFPHLWLHVTNDTPISILHCIILLILSLTLIWITKILVMTVKMQENKVGILMIKNYSLRALTYLIACSSHIHNMHISVVNQSVYIFLHQLVIYQLYNHFF